MTLFSIAIAMAVYSSEWTINQYSNNYGSVYNFNTNGDRAYYGALIASIDAAAVSLLTCIRMGAVHN